MTKIRIIELNTKPKRYRVERKTIFGNWKTAQMEVWNSVCFMNVDAEFDTFREAKELINPKPTVGKVVYEQ